jgi:NAD-dependent SIR2 family protein deacetylase
MKTAIFLGAGASAAEGAPIQSNLFKDYFHSVKDQPLMDAPPNSPLWMKKELSDFFKAMFNIEVPKNTKKLDEVAFPTFEEALGLLDLAESRREAFKDYDLEVFGPAGNRIRLVRQFMVLAMAKAISDSLKHSQRLHRALVDNLSSKRLLKDTIFISTNYDILIDNALTSLSPNRPGKNLDYGVDFTNFLKPGGWARPGPDAVSLYKLHGSLNWLYCAICTTLTLTPNVKGVIDLITDADTNRDRAICMVCGSIMTPIIVPPTFYKDMSRVFLSLIWNKAENALIKAEHIIFCGYSFPDADMHIKYLLKRIQVNRPDPATLRFTVINHHQGKRPEQVKDEISRFTRFLGTRVNYTKYSFSDFVKEPQIVYKQT